MRLSQQRAEAVQRALVERGIAADRLEARGFGPTRPVENNNTEEGRAANRRVEFHIDTAPPGAEPARIEPGAVTPEPAPDTTE